MSPQRRWSQAGKCTQPFQRDKNNHCISTVHFCNAVNIIQITRQRSYSVADSGSLATSVVKQQFDTGIWLQVNQSHLIFLPINEADAHGYQESCKLKWILHCKWFSGNCKRQIKSIWSINLRLDCELPDHVAEPCSAETDVTIVRQVKSQGSLGKSFRCFAVTGTSSSVWFST